MSLYVAETRIGLAAYLERLRRFPALALAKGRPRDRDPADTVANTWQVSLERIQPVAGAVTLLEVCGFLAPEGIPRELFAQQLEEPVEPLELARLAGDPFVLDAAVASLRRFGLVKADEQALAMHRLLQQVVRDRLDHDAAASRAGLAVRLLAAAFPEDRYKDPRLWPAFARLLPHALAAADQAEQYSAEPDATALVLNQAGWYLLQRARFREAHQLYERALAVAEAAYGPDHPRTAIWRGNFGFALLHGEGDLALARQHLERALTIKEATWGPHHSSVVTSLRHLGGALQQLGDLAAARQQLERALILGEVVWGPDHASTALTLYSLGALLHELRDLAAAQRHLERALAIQKTVWGPDHYYVALGHDYLGGIFRDQGELAATREHFGQALALYNASLGSDHPTVARLLCRLGLVLRDQGDLDTARQRLERSLAAEEVALGPDHLQIAFTLHHLGLVLQEQQNLAGAIQHLERALAIRQATLGPEHSSTKATARVLTKLRT